jgi:hypothetical protein
LIIERNSFTSILAISYKEETKWRAFGELLSSFLLREKIGEESTFHPEEKRVLFIFSPIKKRRGTS